MKLSIVVPCFNEEKTIADIIKRIQALNSKLEKEIIVVDNASTDGTREILKKLKAEGVENLKIIFHKENLGKGTSLRDGIKAAQGDIIVFHDADLEYNPKDIPRLIEPILKGKADVVYGSRLKKDNNQFLLLNRLGNQFLSLVASVLYGVNLTDIETGSKAFRAGVIKSCRLVSSSFDIEAEITGKLLRKKARILEVPIEFSGRTVGEGKKLDWRRDGLPNLLTLLRCRFCK